MQILYIRVNFMSLGFTELLKTFKSTTYKSLYDRANIITNNPSDTLGPVLVNLSNTLGPVVTTLSDTLGPVQPIHQTH